MPNQCDHSQINISIGRLEGKIDGIASGIDRINGSLLRHDTEIKDINKWRNRLIGKISIIISMVGAVITGILLYFK